jgi:hypothetical protein
MKKIVPALILIFLASAQITAQNVGVNTNTPEAALDVNGDVIFRTGDLVVADGITLALDVSSTKFSYYRVTGPVADFTLAGITAGIDGRLLTLFNRSGFSMQLNNEDPSASVTDQIMTGTDADITIPFKGIVNLQYDAIEQKWIVKSSSKGGGTILPGSLWDVSGNNIVNTNTGNVGIGINAPADKLNVVTAGGNYGITHTAGAVTVGTWIGTDAFFPGGWIGTKSSHTLNLFTGGGVSRMTIYPNGNIIVGDNSLPSVGRFSVRTPNNSDGISHLGDGGNILATRMGGTSAGIGTFSPTNMRIFCNGISEIFIATGTGNVGIGTENYGTYKLAVNGNIRTKEVVVESGWADYVFDKNYKLPSLGEVERFIQLNKHLPNIPSAAEIEKEGLQLGDTQKRMMEKIEELMLYVIELNKKIQKLEAEVLSKQ